jgi:hypothetical protein
MKYHPSIRFLIAVLAMVAAIPCAKADGSSCVSIPCLGKCISKEEAAGKAIAMLCMRQSACYKDAECTRLAGGECGWKETPELAACLADTSKNTPSPPPLQK